MAQFRAHNPRGIAAILEAADYLARKYGQAAEQYGQPMQAIETELEDETGKRWKLTFGPSPQLETTE